MKEKREPIAARASLTLTSYIVTLSIIFTPG